MAMSATLALSSSSLQVGQVGSALLTISNSGGSAVNVTQVIPSIINASNNAVSGAVGQVNPYQIPLSVPASGSATISFNVMADAASAGQTVYNGAVYTVGAAILCSDGSYVVPTAQSLTVLPRLIGKQASLALSKVTVSSASISHSGGTSTCTLTVFDKNNNQVSSGGLTVGFSHAGGTATGTFGATTDNGDGTYSSVFTANGSAGTATSVSASINTASVTSSPLPTITTT